uniref:LicD family protein n=1 Tax=Caenorhabditis tropicalis TaxID=1561998 RepID=A0A1I7UVK8_9PELO
MTMSRDTTRNKYLIFFRNFLFPPREPIPAIESVNALAKLRDEMLEFGIFPFLNGGTFLGWYRECSVIPHTTDMDIVNDSFELTLIPKTGFKTPIDLFLMYKEFNNGTENRWVGGLTTTGVKYKYIYPEYDPFCAGDLMGHLFWITCTPEQKIKKEYGPYWYLDENSSKYIWNAAKNSIENGRFTREQMKTETYNEYKI